MLNFFTKISTLIDRCSAFFFALAKILTVVLVLLTTEQVIARYFFSASSIALQELQWHLFGFIFLLAMAYTLKQDEHVRIDIVQTRLSPKIRTLIDIFGILFFLLPMAIAISYFGFYFALSAFDFPNPYPLDHWSSAYFAKDSAGYKLSALLEQVLRKSILLGEISADPGGLEARWIVKAAIPLGFLLLTLQGFSELIKKLTILLRGEKHA